MSGEPVQKFDLKQGDKELTLFFYTIQSGPVQIDLAEDFRAILAYSLDEAVNTIRRQFPVGVPLFLKKRGEIEMKKVVDILAIPFVEGTQVKITEPVEEEKKKGPMDFVMGMMLIADRFVESPRDRASLKRILKKINLENNGTAPLS